MVFSSCAKEEKFSYGTLKINLTDAPFPIEFIDSANVLITKVDVRIKNDTMESAFAIVSDDTVSYNLLGLRNGVTAQLAEKDLLEGEVDLIRLYVGEASLTLTTGERYAVKVPSGPQTGIKVFIDPPLHIAGNLTTEALLDFSLEKSFVLKGNIDTPAGIKGFNFKPVVRAANLSATGTVSGWVLDVNDAVIANAPVWIDADSTIASAMTDQGGYFAIPGITAGTYSLRATSENYDTVVFENVFVRAGKFSEITFKLSPTE